MSKITPSIPKFPSSGSPTDNIASGGISALGTVPIVDLAPDEYVNLLLGKKNNIIAEPDPDDPATIFQGGPTSQLRPIADKRDTVVQSATAITVAAIQSGLLKTPGDIHTFLEQTFKKIEAL